jgi:hypothetical protein
VLLHRGDGEGHRTTVSGGWVIFRKERPVSFSRAVCTTFHRPVLRPSPFRRRAAGSLDRVGIGAIGLSAGLSLAAFGSLFLLRPRRAEPAHPSPVRG